MKIGIKNISKRPITNLGGLGPDNPTHPNTYEIYTSNLKVIEIIEIVKNISKSTYPTMEIHIDNFSYLDGLFLCIKNVTIWLELGYCEFLKEINNIKKLNIPIVINIKMDYPTFLSLPNKNEIMCLDNEINIVDPSLYEKQKEPSKLFKLREKTIKTTKETIAYCKENNYIVFDMETDKFLSCIDLDTAYDTREEAIRNRNKNELCNYFCNKEIYIFEEKLKRRIK
jgi:hypothetical protein